MIFDKDIKGICGGQGAFPRFLNRKSTRSTPFGRQNHTCTFCHADASGLRGVSPVLDRNRYPPKRPPHRQLEIPEPSTSISPLPRVESPIQLPSSRDFRAPWQTRSTKGLKGVVDAPPHLLRLRRASRCAMYLGNLFIAHRRFTS